MARLYRAAWVRNLFAGAAACAVAAPLAAAAQVALPTGGVFRSGTGAIATSGSTLTVTQSTQTGIVTWTGFSIGKGGTVQFNNGAGATLNRVGGGNITEIAGALNATGSLYLINPQGIVISAGGKVVTGGDFVAATREITTNAFLAGGDLAFKGSGAGAVTNQGSVVAGGDVVLIGAGVTNAGAIQAGGTASFAAGEDVLLSRATDQHLFVKTGVGDVTNTGVVNAAAAELRAAGGNVYALAGNGDGAINATGTATIGGHLWLTSQTGAVNVTGALTASNLDGSGGFIETSGATLNVAGAKVAAGAGGHWVLDPVDMTVDSDTAAAIDATLDGGTNVTVMTSDAGGSGPGLQNPGNGDIFVSSPVSWSSAATLTLSAWRNIQIGADITVAGGGGLALTTNTGLGGGDYLIKSGHSISFTGGPASAAALSVNGSAYTLLYSMADVQAINTSSTTLRQKYALAQSLDAASDPSTPAVWKPIGTNGTSGITNLRLGFSGTFAGLGHTVANLSMDLGAYNYAGLFGYSSGTLRDIGTVGGSVNATKYAGGLAGWNAGTIMYAYSTAAVGGTISGFATGSVNVGGLVGSNSGIVTRSYATGVGYGRLDIGGLVGINQTSGKISESYATGDIFAGHYGGGLVGWNYGTITNVFATGNIGATAPSSDGGLVGRNGGLVAYGYSTGTVTDLTGIHPSTQERPYVGSNYGGTVIAGYWDIITSNRVTQGKPTNAGYSPNITGMTTAQLHAALPAGFDPAIWGSAPGVYPFLLWTAP